MKSMKLGLRSSKSATLIVILGLLATVFAFGPLTSTAQAATITVTFSPNGGTGVMNPQVAVTGQTLTPNSFTKAGFTFAGWSGSAGGPIIYRDAATITATSNLNLYARWSPLTYTVSFNSNGGSGTMLPQQVLASGAALKFNSFSRSAYTFTGWAFAPEGPVALANGAVYRPSGPVTLYAIWSPTNYVLTFNPNGGTGTVAPVSFNALAGTLPANGFTRTGYTFAGWAKTATGPVFGQPGDAYTTPGSTTIYASWLRQPSAPGAPVVSGHTVGPLVWSDEFTGASGSSLNSAFWTGRYCGQSAANGGGTCYNSELQYFMPSATTLDGSLSGNAVITTKHISSPPAGSGPCYVAVCSFTSGRFDTQGKVSFQYGYIETRMQMPVGSGNWPAFWMLGDNITTGGWPYSGEVDIAEQGGNLPMRNSAAVHYSTNGIPGSCCANATYDTGQVVNVANYQTGFHTYGLAWLPDLLEFYVDGKKFFTVSRSSIRSSQWAFNSPFFLIYDNAVGMFGGTYSGWSQSQTKIDYVRVWTLDGQGTVTLH